MKETDEMNVKNTFSLTHYTPGVIIPTCDPYKSVTNERVYIAVFVLFVKSGVDATHTAHLHSDWPHF